MGLIHIAYADSLDGSTNFNFVAGAYLGSYDTPTDVADSTNPLDYNWVKILGATGQAGGTGLRGAKGNPGITGLTGLTGLSGLTPVYGVDYVDGASGEFISFVYCSVLKGAAAPTIINGTGSYDGTTEVAPAGSNIWTDNSNHMSGYTTYISSNRYVYITGTTWNLKNAAWATPTVFADTPSNPDQTQITAFAFKRSASTLTTAPTGGSYALPTPDGWSDGIPVGTSPIWVVTVTFTSDGLSPQPAGSPVTWSVPELLSQNGTGVKHQFSDDGITGWSDTPTVTSEWMATCTQDTSGAWVCDYAGKVKIKGEIGQDAQGQVVGFAFKRSTDGAFSEVPVGGDYTSPFSTGPAGWQDSVPGGTGVLYTSTRMFTSDGALPQDAAWAAPRAFSDIGYSTKLTASDYSVIYDDAGENPTPNTITLTSKTQGFTIPWFKFTGSTLLQNGEDTSYTVGDGVAGIRTDQHIFEVPASITNFSAPQTVTIQVGEESETEAATDSITIFGIQSGGTGYTVILPNDAHVLQQDSGGTTDYTGSGTIMEVYKGGTALESVNAIPGAGEFSVVVEGTSITPNPTPTIGLDNWTIGDHSAMVLDTASITYTINIENIITTTKKQSFSRVSDGFTPYVGTLTADSFVIKFTKAGTETDSINLTATSSGFNEPYYEFKKGAVVLQGPDTLTTYTLGQTYEPALDEVADIVMNVYEGVAGVVVEASDTISIFAVQDGQNGVDGLTPILTNSAHAIPCDYLGNPQNFTNSGTDIRLYEGASQLIFDGVGTSAGTWTVTNSTYLNVTPDSTASIISAQYAQYGNITGMSQDSGYIDYTLSGRTNDNTPFTGIVVRQTFTKTKNGQNGTSITGPIGLTVQHATGYLWYTVAQTGTPAAPTMGTNPYSFTSGTLTFSGTNWSATPPEMAPGTSAVYWYVKYWVNQVGTANQTKGFGAVSKGTNFSGLVTFANLTDGVTTIDGGNIKTGTIDAINITGSTITGSILQTDTTGQRIKINDATNDLTVYNSTNSPITLIGSGSGGYGIWAKGIGAVPAIKGETTSASTPAIWGAASSGGNAFYGKSTGGAAAQFITSANALGLDVKSENAGLSAHAIRGTSKSSSGGTTRAAGLVATAGGYAFLAEEGVAGPFTGAHSMIGLPDIDAVLGDIIIDGDIVSRKGISDTVFMGTPSSQKRQLGAIGVLSRLGIPVNLDNIPALIETWDDVDKPGQEEVPANERSTRQVPRHLPAYTTIKDTHYSYVVNSIGEGQMNVCGEGGDILKGTFIMVSAMQGKGMAQDDDLVHTYTVARARETVTFTNTNEVKMIACIYMCG